MAAGGGAVRVSGADGQRVADVVQDSGGVNRVASDTTISSITGDSYPTLNRKDADNQTVTASGNSGTLDTKGFSSLSMIFNVTAISGSGATIYFDVKTSNDGTNWAQLHSVQKFTATGTQSLPGIRDTSKYYRIEWTVSGTTPSITFTITTTLKTHSTGGNRSQFRYSDIDLTAVNNTSSVFTVFSNENISLMVVRGADGGNTGKFRVQVSNDGTNWDDLSADISSLASTTNTVNFSNQAFRSYRLKVTAATNAGTRTLDLFWNANGGG